MSVSEIAVEAATFLVERGIPVPSEELHETAVACAAGKKRTRALKAFLQGVRTGAIAIVPGVFCEHGIPLQPGEVESDKSAVCPVCQLPANARTSQKAHAWNSLLCVFETGMTSGAFIGNERIVLFSEKRGRVRKGATKAQVERLTVEDEENTWLDKREYELAMQGVDGYGPISEPDLSNRKRVPIPIDELFAHKPGFLARKYGISRQAVNAQKRKWTTVRDTLSPEEVDALLELQRNKAA